ncbi:thiamine phosphate synthase [Pontibacillus sp. HMF3514]|uniref:thiamine phosphate synthase n=1 Tax=Pontibacillus sp. HMF3514 TaxID=2692425 RepID=UPI0013203A98|nr:thiamine phosphate synthase [Pontibacillus sp. HMF3514]QHE53509.1 thiamine phosphate synthase [Pontibacillus sp. HMF3514]
MSIAEHLPVYLVMGSQNCYQDPIEVLRKAIQGGVTCFQYREKGNGAKVGSEREELGFHLKKVCHNYGIPFIVNDDVNLAIQLEADGVHIGQQDGLVQEVRSIIGSEKLLGVSAHNVKEAEKAIEEGADYIGVGPMFHTSTKKDTEQVRGPIVIREIRDVFPVFPIVGIGGISKKNAYDVVSSGANGVAVISAISQAENAVKASQELKQEVEDGRLTVEK